MDNQFKTESRQKTVAIALSGGIDSAFSAKILQDLGYKVFGVTMQLFDDELFMETRDRIKKIAQILGIDFYIVDIRKEFKKLIIDPFYRVYLKGQTPNPCIECNRLIKFGLLLKEALQMGADFLATGHYAKVTRKDSCDEFEIKKGADATKDQSYFLWRLTQENLANILLPLGDLIKKDIKNAALKLFPFLAGRSESQEVCFLNNKSYKDFLADIFDGDYPLKDGPIIDTSGKVLGTHSGFPFYTIGQRKGIGVSYSKPLYVIRISPADNTIVVGEEKELLCGSFNIHNVNFVSKIIPTAVFKCNVKIRYNSQAKPAIVIIVDKNEAKINFLTPQKAVTPGQSAVFYLGDAMLGGGIISQFDE